MSRHFALVVSTKRSLEAKLVLSSWLREDLWLAKSFHCSPALESLCCTRPLHACVVILVGQPHSSSLMSWHSLSLLGEGHHF